METGWYTGRKQRKKQQNVIYRGNRMIYRKETGECIRRKQENKQEGNRKIQRGNRRIYREETGAYKRKKQENLQEIIQGGNSRYNGSHMKRQAP